MQYLTSLAVTVGECLGDDAANWYRGGSTVVAPPAGNTTTTGATGGSNSTTTGTGGSGKGGSGSPVPTWTYPPPTSAQGWGGWKPSGGSHGGDTQPGHGDNAGRGALPGHQGQGTVPVEGCNSTTGYVQGGSSGSPGSVTGAVGHAAGYVSHVDDPAKANFSSNSSNPAYYVNGASSFSVSAAMLVGAAVLGFFL